MVKHETWNFHIPVCTGQLVRKHRDKWSPVTTTWRSLMVWAGESASIYGRLGGSILIAHHKQWSVSWHYAGSRTMKEFLASLAFRSWRLKKRVPSKHLLTFAELHGVISQKVELFITTGVTTSNPTTDEFFWKELSNCMLSDFMWLKI
jgi:hypothetical protein